MAYCMWLDADDVLEPPDLDALLALKKTLPPETDVVMMRYNERAGTLKPEDPAYLYNKAFFAEQTAP